MRKERAVQKAAEERLKKENDERQRAEAERARLEAERLKKAQEEKERLEKEKSITKVPQVIDIKSGTVRQSSGVDYQMEAEFFLSTEPTTQFPNVTASIGNCDSSAVKNSVELYGPNTTPYKDFKFTFQCRVSTDTPDGRYAFELRDQTSGKRLAARKIEYRKPKVRTAPVIAPPKDDETKPIPVSKVISPVTSTPTSPTPQPLQSPEPSTTPSTIPTVPTNPSTVNTPSTPSTPNPTITFTQENGFETIISEIIARQPDPVKRLITIEVTGTNLPTTMVAYVKDCDKIQRTDKKPYSTEKASFNCEYFSTTPSNPEGTMNDKDPNILKTDTRTNGGVEIAGSAFKVVYIAPPGGYTIDWIYPSVEQGFTISKNTQNSAFIYFQVNKSDFSSADFTVQYELDIYNGTIDSRKLKSFEKTDWNNALASYDKGGSFAFKIPASRTNTGFQIMKVNGTDQFTRLPEIISIKASKNTQAELIFTEEKALGAKAHVNPVLAVGGGWTDGGSLTTDVSFSGSDISEQKTFPITVTTREGGEGEITAGRKGKAIPIGAEAKLSGKYEGLWSYDFDYQNLKKLIDPKLYQLYRKAMFTYIEKRNAYQQAYSCKYPTSIPTGEPLQSSKNGTLQAPVFSIERCKDLYEAFSQLEIQQVVFKKVADSVRQKLLESNINIPQAIALFDALKEGFSVSGSTEFNTSYLKALEGTKVSESAIEKILAQQQKEIGYRAEVSLGGKLGLDGDVFSANAEARAKGIYGSKDLIDDPGRISKITSETQEVSGNIAVGASLANPLFKTIISESGANRVAGKIFTLFAKLFPKDAEKYSDKYMCQFMKTVLARAGNLPRKQDYSRDCRGFQTIIDQLGTVQVSLSAGDIQTAFKEILGLSLDNTSAALIEGILAGEPIDLLGTVTDLPKEKAMTLEKHYEGSSLRKMVFEVSTTARGLGPDQVFVREYTFTNRNGTLSEPISNALVYKQFEEYLRRSELNEAITLDVKEYQILSSVDSNLPFSIGWGLEVYKNRQTGHESKIPVAEYKQLRNKSLVKTSEIDQNNFSVFDQQLKILTDKNYEENLNMESILSNLYEIILIGSDAYKALEKKGVSPSKIIPVNKK